TTRGAALLRVLVLCACLGGPAARTLPGNLWHAGGVPRPPGSGGRSDAPAGDLGLLLGGLRRWLRFGVRSVRARRSRGRGGTALRRPARLHVRLRRRARRPGPGTARRLGPGTARRLGPGAARRP